MNTELSRLAFEERLIEFCEDTSVPLLERVRLLAIAGSRLDTFFMTRVGRLKRLASIGPADRMIGGVTSVEQLNAVAAEGHRILTRAYRLLEEQLIPALDAVGVRIECWDDLPQRDREFAQLTSGARLSSSIRPLIARPGLPFPHVRNLRPAVLIVIPAAKRQAENLMVIELPEELPRFVPLAGGHRLVPLEDVIEAALPALRPDVRVAGVYVFRVTRSAIMEFGDDPDDVLETVEQEVARRPFQEVVRVEFENTMPAELRDRLLGDLRREAQMQASSLDERDMYGVRRLVDLAALSQIADLDLPELKSAPVERRVTRLSRGMFESVRARDVLLRFPFDSYEASLERFLREAAERDDVDAIKMTLYRTGRDSKVVEALRTARARGVDVTAVVELKASFDERDNIDLARALESDGVRVVLSPATLKVHAKIGLVTLRNGSSRRQLAMIGTGNLNAETARSYVDLWLLTADPECAGEVGDVFDILTGTEVGAGNGDGAAGAGGAGGAGDGGGAFKNLLVAPFNMRRRFVELIDREASHAREGRECGIRVVLNGVTDEATINALHRASQAGVSVDMMVRGVCALQPGVPGISENIRVVSVVGQLLQHARIFHFRNGGADEYFIGSADWRERNFDRRIEVVTTVRRPNHALLDAALDDTLNDRGAWLLRSDGVYVRNGKPPTRGLTAAGRR